MVARIRATHPRAVGREWAFRGFVQRWRPSRQPGFRLRARQVVLPRTTNGCSCISLCVAPVRADCEDGQFHAVLSEGATPSRELACQRFDTSQRLRGASVCSTDRGGGRGWARAHSAQYGRTVRARSASRRRGRAVSAPGMSARTACRRFQQAPPYPVARHRDALVAREGRRARVRHVQCLRPAALQRSRAVATQGQAQWVFASRNDERNI